MFSSLRRTSNSNSYHRPPPSLESDQDSALDAAFSDPSPDAYELPSSPSPSQHHRPSSPTSPIDDDPLTRYAARYNPSSDSATATGSSRQPHTQTSISTSTSTSTPYDFEGDPFAHRAGAVRAGESPPGYDGEDDDEAGHGHGHGHGRERSEAETGGERTMRERLFPSFYARVAADDPDSQPRASADSRPREEGGGSWFAGRTGGLFGILRNGIGSRGGGGAGAGAGAGGAGNDGVFANLQASRPGGRTGGMPGDWDAEDDNKDEPLPSYEAAAADSTPPYWETTVMAPVGYLGPDDILVDGLPVGNLFAFAWNLLVSMSFQFVGFLLTYLLHTSHAAKNGSRAGLGITLIQYGLYLRNAPRGGDGSFLLGPDVGNSTVIGEDGSGSADGDDGWFWPTGEQTPSGLAGGGGGGGGEGEAQAHADGVPDLGIGEEEQLERDMASEWMAWMIIAIGWGLVLGGYINYWRAIRWAKAVRDGGSGGLPGREENGLGSTTTTTTTAAATGTATETSGRPIVLTV